MVYTFALPITERGEKNRVIVLWKLIKSFAHLHIYRFAH